MSGIGIILFYVVIIGVMYFVIVYPQRKADKKKKEMLGSLHIGDEITTIGGIHGKIVTIAESYYSIQLIDDKVRMRVEKWAIKDVLKHVEGKKQVEEKHKVEEKRKITRLAKVETPAKENNDESAE